MLIQAESEAIANYSRIPKWMMATELGISIVNAGEYYELC